MNQTPKHVLLRIRPSLPDPDEVSAARGPIMMEAVIAAIHSLKKTHGQMSLEIGNSEGKIVLFARADAQAAPLVESQLYAQYPDAEIDREPKDLFATKRGENVWSCDLVLTDAEIFPIKRYPQFTDLATRQAIDTIAGITSTLVRYPKHGMRGHIQIIFRPIGHRYRRAALRFLPLLTRGLSRHSQGYARFFAKMHLARGWKKLLFLGPDIAMGGFRAWFLRPPKVQTSLLTGDEVSDTTPDEEAERGAMRNHDREDPVTAAVDKMNHLLFLCNIRVSVIADAEDEQEARAKVEEIASSFRQFTLPQCNGFRHKAIRSHAQIPSGFVESPYVLSAEELATIWHVPNILVKTPNIDWVLSKQLEPPVDLPISSTPDPSSKGGGGNDPDLTILGQAVFRGHHETFGIRPDDRRRHIYIIGKTGMGKSTLLENMIFSDIHAGKGVAVVDPHGDLVEAVLRFIPAKRSNDVILFDPADKEFPVSFNMLQCENAEERVLVVSGLMSVFKKLWPEAFSGRMEYILRNTLLALTEAENQSMLGIMRMFSDASFRAKILERVSNHMVKSFWQDEFTTWSEKYQTEALAAIQNKIGQLLSAPLIRNIVGQVVSKLDIRHAMDTGKIILMNLSKGKLGEDNSAFLGSMFVTKFQLDAMSRADVPENDRRDFYLYVDEFQNFATESFATILSEARKYRLNLTMAHQYVGQLLLQNGNTALRDAVFGNVGSIVCFQVGSDDAEPLSEQFEEMVLPKDILSLPKYHAYMRLMIKGIPSKPFSVRTLPPPDFRQDEGRMEKIKNLSRERYAEERVIVEDKIGKWVASARAAHKSAKSFEKSKEKEEEEKKRAKAKGLPLEDYRKWRDREMWTNDYNMLRKKKFKGEALTKDDDEKMKDLEKKLEASGGVPPPSKTMTASKK
ncbi:type IV secretion system DNA-binding domain-containing protein [Candidatus Peregrinibacteria bacterium]|nr:type IV secretion system DNA-binding domain-containing protein [Candidatus Peregrinibacteria bacterium]MBI3816294.1 type IV secretion system DNA-binding domain-containing protein [Candidatus Peregrinibacteria bacterium]